MKLLPKTLLTRLVLLIATLLVISQLVSLKIFDLFEREPRAKALAEEITTIVNFTKASITAAASHKRIKLLNELSSMSDVRIYPATLFEEATKPIPDDPFLKLVVNKIQQKLPPDTQVAVNHYGVPGIWVSFEINGDLFWAVILRSIVDRPFPWHWMGWGTIIAILTIGAAYATTRRIIRTINQLITAARKVRQGQEVDPLPLGNVDEFKELSIAFNEMIDNLSKINDERKFLLASVSHDIRTPLTRLRIASEMVSSESNELKKSMEEDIIEINEILNQFLDFVRGFDDEPKSPINLNKILKEIQTKHLRMGQKFTIKKKNNKLNISKKLYVDLRPLAFQRCIDNLINNAFYYSKGKVIVEVNFNEESFTISIIDNGPGIPEKQKVKLLQPFERVDEARGNMGGCGLGLTIADRIAKAHDGKLELINLKKGGLEAKITIPIITA